MRGHGLVAHPSNSSSKKRQDAVTVVHEAVSDAMKDSALGLLPALLTCLSSPNLHGPELQELRPVQDHLLSVLEALDQLNAGLPLTQVGEFRASGGYCYSLPRLSGARRTVRSSDPCRVLRVHCAGVPSSIPRGRQYFQAHGYDSGGHTRRHRIRSPLFHGPSQ